MPLNRVVILRNIDRQDRQDKQDEKLLHRKLTGSMIGSAFEAIQNLHYFRNVGATSCPWCLSWWPFTDPFRVFSNSLESLRGLIFNPLNRYFSPFLEIFSPYPTFGGSLLSLLQPLRVPSRTPFPTFGGSLSSLLQRLRGPSPFFVALRGYLFAFSWKSFLPLATFGRSLLSFLQPLSGPSWIILFPSCSSWIPFVDFFLGPSLITSSIGFRHLCPTFVQSLPGPRLRPCPSPPTRSGPAAWPWRGKGTPG